MSGIGANSMQVPSDILLRLVDATEEIRNLLRQKAGQENGSVQQINGASGQDEDSPDVANAAAHQPVNTEMANLETDRDDWPNNKTVARYRKRCARHERECEKMQVELGCFIAHLVIVGGDKDVIEKAESLRKVLLGPVQCLETVFRETPKRRGNAMGKVKDSFFSLRDLIYDFSQCPRHEHVLYPNKVTQWESISYNGRRTIIHLVDAGDFGKCLNFIHNEFFADLETAMSGVVEALMTFKQKSVDKWLKMQKTDSEVFEEPAQNYISCVFPPKVSEAAATAWSEAEKNLRLTHFTAHRKSCIKMQEELDHLIAHYYIIGGDSAVITASKKLHKMLTGPVEHLEQALAVQPFEQQTEIRAAIISFAKLHSAIDGFLGSLYHQKHAFYFRKVNKWMACVRDGLPRLLATFQNPNCFLDYICDELLLALNYVMIGVSDAVEEPKASKDKFAEIDVGNVAEELKTFGKESLPKFLVDQMERDTTRYVNLTTIATFFSSVTATTLQFTYAETDAVPSNSLRGVVNLFWFLSLVFSVSSGVSSLLGLTWRKSSIYDFRGHPKLIRMWLDKAPTLFLIIAAVAFVIGLNMFAYLSVQPHFVSIATNILTGLHGMCLLTVTLWFIYKLKHESVWAGRIRTVMESITKFTVWIKTGVRWFSDMVKRPYDKYKLNLHLQRNIFWAFGFDNRVARLNPAINGDDHGPEPFLLSKLIRRIAYPIKKYWLVTKGALSYLVHFAQKHMCVLACADHTEGDVERGERGTRNITKAPENSSPSSPTKKAKSEFRRSLQKIFSEARWVDNIMEDVEVWEDLDDLHESRAKHRLGRKLWGYPDILKECHRLCQELKEERNESIERERQQAIRRPGE